MPFGVHVSSEAPVSTGEKVGRLCFASQTFPIIAFSKLEGNESELEFVEICLKKGGDMKGESLKMERITEEKVRRVLRRCGRSLLVRTVY